MDEDIVQKITEQVLRKLGQSETTSNENPIKTKETGYKRTNPLISTGSAIILLCGGDEKLPEVYQQMEEISRRFSPVHVVMTKSATQIIGIPKARSASQGGKIITEYSSDYLEKVLKQADAIYVPVISLNTAAKVTALNADSLGTITIVFGLMYGKPVIVAKNSIFCCQIKPENVPEPMLKRINGIIKLLEDMGVQIVDIHDLTGAAPIQEIKSPSTVYTTGTAGKLNGDEIVKAFVNGGASRIGTNPGIAEFDKDLAKYIDHTLLKADATEEEIRKLCDEAKDYGFASVCVNPTNVSKAKENLRGSSVKVCTVVGFPLGATTPTVKAIETRDAIANGAEEIDMVINVGALKSGDDELVKRDIEAVVAAAKGKALVKVILETALLTKEQITKGSLLTKLAGADFVKTSTGFSTAGATAEDIELMRKTVGPEMGVKAAGGIRTLETAEKMIKAGATRIGASASIAIVKGTTSSSEKY